jgi:hypothetical protein
MRTLIIALSHLLPPHPPPPSSVFPLPYSSLFLLSLQAYNDMVGTLPPEVRHLRYLKVLHVSDNREVGGEIPMEYGTLKNLEVRE